MSRSPEWIISAYRARRDAAGPGRARMAEVAATYDGIVSVPLPELDANESAAVANLMTQGLDQMAMRVASVSPQIVCPPLVQGQRRAEENARIRRLANTAWWQENRFDRKQRKRARWLIGYAHTPVVIRPDRKRQIPIWELRDPLSSYPAPMPIADDICPDNSIFALRRTWGWINERWPDKARALNPATAPDPDDLFEVLEYIDAEEHVLVATGKPASPQESGVGWGARKPAPQGAPFAELDRFDNLVGRCTVVAPTRLALNDPAGQFDQMPGLYRMQAKAMALWLIATQRSIFPDTWFVSRPNETVTVVERPDGPAGVPGLVKGGDLREVTAGPPPQVGQVIDVLERNQRVTAGISPDFGGENPTNVRTGRAGTQLLSATVDYWVQEAQETLGMSYVEENRLAVAVARSYFGSAKKSFFVNFKGAKGPVDYVPSVNFDSDANQVTWPHAGSDVNSLIIGIGQRLGLKEMSVRTAQEMDPYIDDPEREHDRITAESMEAALLAAIDQAAGSGQLGPLEIGRIYQLVIEEKTTLFEAVQRVHQETQDQQAQAGAPGGPPGGPGGSGAPPGPPGLMAPGLQQQLGVGPMNPPGGGVPTPTPSVAHMAQLMGALRPRKAG